MTWESSTDIFGRFDWLTKKVKNLLGRVYALENGGSVAREVMPGEGVVLNNGSQLREGTINAGYGGGKGIAQICAIGYELKWEAGRLYVMNDGGTTIREVLYNFTTAPSIYDDISLGFVVGSRWILDNGDVYVCTNNTLDNAVWTFKSANPYKVYTALLTQSGESNVLEKVQGDTLVLGTTYYIFINEDNVDLTVFGAPNSNEGTSFVCTQVGNLPGGVNISLQYDTGAPVVKVLENTIGNIWFTYDSMGTFVINSDGLFIQGKTYIAPQICGEDQFAPLIGVVKYDSNSQVYLFAMSANGALYDGPISPNFNLYSSIEIKVYN